MKTLKTYKKIVSEILLSIFIVGIINPAPLSRANNNDEIIYPLKEISKLECRFKDWGELSSNCKQSLPILKTKDYEKYAKKDGGYNDFTRIYTVLWASSYKYGWDVGNGGHMGTDIATSKGTPVYSMAKGTVINAKWMGALGNNVSVEHNINGKKVVSNYSHLSKIDVSVGEKVNVGEKIGEVGSTGNSTGNHLHFQIDLDTPFHPYYHDYNSCPHSYYKITEQGLCFDELNKNTLDPLLFLETNGKVLDNIKVTKVSRDTISNSSNSSTNTTQLSIFSKTVYVGYPTSDIKEVQKIFREMGVYTGEISGNYNDIKETIIAYQIATGVIQNRNENGAGWFGPKTRAQTKKDYNNHLAGKSSITEELVVETKVETKKISRKNLLTREEIEAREVKDFLRKYNVDLTVRNVGGNIKLGETAYIDLKVTDRKGKAFKGSMPGGMTFIVDQNKVNVFPQKLYYFTDGKRTIHLKGLQLGSTTLHVKIGSTTIETIPLHVYNKESSIKLENGIMLASKKVIVGEPKTGIVLLRGEDQKKLINIEYKGQFKLQTSEGAKVCLKSGDIKNIRKIYKDGCANEEYKDYVYFDYHDTVGGLVIFDYKGYTKNAKIELISQDDNTSLTSTQIAVSDPKGLAKNYEYRDEVVSMLEKGITDGVNKGYFLEDRPLSEYDGLSWIRNSLIQMNNDPDYFPKKSQIENNLRAVFAKREKASKRTYIDREDFLTLTYEYLLLDKDKNIKTPRNYKDLDDTLNKKVTLVFGQDNTWKDRFGEHYFRPGENITRGEGSYLLSNAIQKNQQILLTLK